VIGPPGTRPAGALLAAIENQFGGFEAFRQQFTASALGLAASGWTFLVLDPRTQGLQVLSLPDNGSVLPIGKAGLLICDLWEHAYYLKYKADTAAYLEAFWSLVDWNVVGERYLAFRTHFAP